MVVKSRTRTRYATVIVDGVVTQVGSSGSTTEKLSDSSVSGSAKTDVEAVDKFLSKPTNQQDFTAALRQSYRTAGDAGISDFQVDRTSTNASPFSGSWKDQSWQKSRVFSGATLQQPYDSEFPSVTPYVALSRGANIAVGQKLYLRSLPNRDQAALGTVLGEIVTNPVRAMAIPGLVSARAASRHGRLVQLEDLSLAHDRHSRLAGLPLEQARAAADDYLAYIFGVRPTVQDLDKLAESITGSRRLAETVSRVATKRIRRRRGNPQRKRAGQVYLLNQQSPFRVRTDAFNIVDLTLNGTRLLRSETTQDTWFSAAFRMSVTDTDHWLGQCSDLFKYIDRLSGIGLDVKVAWDLIPFSFMADWFANTGDFLEHRTIVADYNIACEYGYAMCHTRRRKTLVANGLIAVSGMKPTGPSVSALWESFTETKMRTACSSYGFSYTPEDLNTYQWGALTALGLTSIAGVSPSTRA